MSEPIKHECGIALIRLRKPLSYYTKKYGSPAYGMKKLYVLMEKQHNRGQDGAGVANIKLDIESGFKFFSRIRSVEPMAIKDITAVTPITMPKSVSPARSLFAPIEERAVRSISIGLIVFSLVEVDYRSPSCHRAWISLVWFALQSRTRG